MLVIWAVFYATALFGSVLALTQFMPTWMMQSSAVAANGWVVHQSLQNYAAANLVLNGAVATSSLATPTWWQPTVTWNHVIDVGSKRVVVTWSTAALHVTNLALARAYYDASHLSPAAAMTDTTGKIIPLNGSASFNAPAGVPSGIAVFATQMGN